MSWHPNHPPCDCGCGELADECAGPRPNPLGSMRVTQCPLHPDAPTPCHTCGAARARAAIRTRPAHTTDTDPTRARAIERARTERNTKEAP